MLTKLYHYSKQKLELDRNRVYDQSIRTLISNPVGFWVSPDCDEGWEAYLKREEVDLEDLAYKTEIILNVPANIKIIDTMDKLQEFADKYKSLPEFYRGVKDDGLRATILKDGNNLVPDWGNVAKDYSGIMIIPFRDDCCKDFYSNTTWYYGWDCASGCIWDLSVIKCVKSA